MTALPLTFAETYPGGRILLMLGQHQAGAVFPPAVASDKTDRHPWVWRFWLTTTARDGRSKTEQGARHSQPSPRPRIWLRILACRSGTGRERRRDRGTPQTHDAPGVLPVIRKQDEH